MTAGALAALGALSGVGAWIVAVDLRRMVIPDRANAALLVAGVAASLGLGIVEPMAAFVAAVVALLILLAVRAFFRTVRGYDGLGLGDVKFVAAAAIWTGGEGLPMALVAASGAALLYLGGRAALDRRFDLRARLPFGPFLVFGVLAVAAPQLVTGRDCGSLVLQLLA